MKKYMIFLLCTALLLGIACTAREYIISFEYNPAAVSEDDAFAYLHKTVDNSEQPRNLILVNDWNCVPENYEVELYKTSNGEYVAEQIYPFLEEMFEDAKTDGHSPELTSGYRSKDEQQELFDGRVKEYRAVGYSKKEATSLTNEYAARPGYSEHETGLAVDINSTDGDSRALYGWLKDNCYKYGFILRYPDGKEDITGIGYEPWHFRYIGKEEAEYIYEHGITLEEYILL